MGFNSGFKGLKRNCVGKSGKGTGYLSEYLDFPVSITPSTHYIHLYNSAVFIIRTNGQSLGIFQ